ncbi:uncharacterized protein LOC142589872 [Dermacentor variabilis]|uniref:uncharacterized protein LOC142589872 n=1 Tax=Dermacentor variabilis TaxID=34621 RepID=UPI003F5B0AE8
MCDVIPAVEKRGPNSARRDRPSESPTRRCRGGGARSWWRNPPPHHRIKSPVPKGTLITSTPSIHPSCQLWKSGPSTRLVAVMSQSSQRILHGMSDDAYKAKLQRCAAAKKRRRAEETDEEREQRLAKRRAYYAARRMRSTSLDLGASTSITHALNADATLATSDRSAASLMNALNGNVTASTRSMSSMELYNLNRRRRRAEETPEQREQRLARERERDAARKAKRDESRRKRQAEESPEARAQRLKKRREKSLAKARQRQRREERARRVKECEPATREFHKRFTNNPFGCVCSVRERLWHKDKLTPVSELMFPTLRRAYPELVEQTLASAVVCGTCKSSLGEEKIPLYSVSNGYEYPPMPEGLLRLNPVAERLLSPRIPFYRSAGS